MNLERLPEKLTVATTILVGMIFAVLAGTHSGQGEGKTILMVIGGAVLIAVAIVIRERAWVLIPGAWVLVHPIPLPIPLAPREAATLFAFILTLMLMALKRVRRKPTYGLLDVLIVIQMAYLVTAFIRNPAGVNIFGATRVGGRPYFEIFIGFLSYWVLSRAVATQATARTIPVLMMLAAIFVSGLGLLVKYVPSAIPIVARIYPGAITNASSIFSQDTGFRAEGTRRITVLEYYAKTASVVLCSYFRPLTLIVPLWFGRFVLFLLLLLSLVMSGFRSQIIYFGALFAMGTCFRRGWRELVPAGLAGTIILVLLLVCQGHVFQLPIQAQRALSFLPGKWDPVAKGDADSSAEWRFQMWRMAMDGSSPYSIQDKIFGDGFGFTVEQLQMMQRLTMSGQVIGDYETQMNALICGDYHSGPISTIHHVGYIGLVLYYVFAFVLVRRAWSLIQRAKQTPFFSLSLLIGMPAIMHPFFFTFIFGAYDSDLVNSMFTVGMMKMLENTINGRSSHSRNVSEEHTGRSVLSPIPSTRKPRT